MSVSGRVCLGWHFRLSISFKGFAVGVVGEILVDLFGPYSFGLVDLFGLCGVVNDWIWPGRVSSVLLSSCVICGTVESSSPGKVYRRCIFDSWWACACVCRRVGIAPSYMVARLMRSMWRPQLQPSVCIGVLLVIIGWVTVYSSGGVKGWVVYHCLSVVCMFWAVCGVGKLSGS